MKILTRVQRLEEELLPPPMMQVIATIHIVHGRRDESDSLDPEKGNQNWVQREPIVITGEPFTPVDWSRRKRYGRRRGSR